MFTRFVFRSVFVFFTWPLQLLFRGVGNLVQVAMSLGFTRTKPAL